MIRTRASTGRLSEKDAKLPRLADFKTLSPTPSKMMKRYLVTGGAGFIGSAVVRHLISATDNHVLVVDKLTYASNLNSLAPVKDHPRYSFIRADIADAETIRDLFASFQPDVVMHLAAESHVDRSIDGPAAFIQTNVVGTFVLLQQALGYWRKLSSSKAEQFRFHHISTDEVFGSLGRMDFSTKKPHTDRIHHIRPQKRHPTTLFARGITLTDSGRYFQLFEQLWAISFPRKTHSIDDSQCTGRKAVAFYGTGENVRDWLYVEDHARALLLDR